LAAEKKQILEALQAVSDEESGIDIVSLGCVRSVQIDEQRVAVQIELTTPNLDAKGRIEEEARRTIEGVADGLATEVTVSNLTAARPRGGGTNSGLSSVKYIVAVASGKGGVGKSTVAAGLAKNLTERGYKVGLLDTDIYGPSVPSLFELQQPELEALENEMIRPVDVDGLKLMSFGFLLGESPAVMRGPMVSRYIQQFLYTVQWDELDYLFLDLPPGTGDIQLTITQTVGIDGAVIVTTPQVLSFADVGKAILMFDKVNVPVLGVVENMSYFECPSCGERHAVFGEGAAKRLTERFGVPILGELPLNHEQYGKDFRRESRDSALGQLANETMGTIGERAVGIAVPEIQHDGTQLTLTWPSGESVTVQNLDLRANCQCAVCVDEFTGRRHVTREDIPADIAAEEVRPLGNYALYIKWSDGHQSGFFPYPLIREVAEGKRN
jgi:Mrp family chromosome partitioning ATPase/DUF971 family protein